MGTFLWLGAFVLLALLIGKMATGLNGPSGHAKETTLRLTRSSFEILDYPSDKNTTSAIIIFGSGDGGWGDFEEAIGHAFQGQGYELIGIDSEAYAQTDYDLLTLQSDFSVIADKAELPFGSHPPPLVIGGYSMGAAQAIAVAGGPNRPHGMIGLLLIDPLSRGRYGLRSSDQMNVLPTGAGTFGVDSFARNMDSLRVVQWHAAEDSIDSRSWLDSLTVQHETLTFPGAGHDYSENRGDFLRQLIESFNWILKNPGNGSLTANAK